MLHPNQFHVDEAWIAFRLNAIPLATDTDGDFHVIALMDAASCFILSSAFVPVSAEDASEEDIQRLLAEAEAHHQQLPATLFISADLPTKRLAEEAERQGVTVARVSDDQLQEFVREARDGFREHFGGGRVQ